MSKADAPRVIKDIPAEKSRIPGLGWLRARRKARDQKSRLDEVLAHKVASVTVVDPTENPNN